MSRIIISCVGISLIGLLACSGGNKSLPPPDTQNDTAEDAVEVADPGSKVDVKSDINNDELIKHDTDVDVDKEVTVPDDIDVSDDVVPTDDNMDSEGTDIRDIDSNGEDVGNNYICTCDDTDNKHPVCGLDKTTTYPNDECALCEQCASIKGYDQCIGCNGTIKNCNQHDDSTYISQKAACNECTCTTEERHSGKVCGACTGEGCCNIIGLGSAKTYSSLCEFKTAVDCSEDPTASADFFSQGECVCSTCQSCEGHPTDPVCGMDGNTYPNKCWLTNCPEGNSTRIDCGAPCIDTQKCPECAGSDCHEVCGEVDKNGTRIQESFFNECAATCAGATIKYKAHCCANCQGQPAKPVCTMDGDGNKVTLANDCEVACSGYSKLYDSQCSDCDCAQGDCICSCSGPNDCTCDCSQATDDKLVCGGEYGMTWPSQCWLDYLNLTKIHDGKCTHECETCSSDTAFAPVCATDNKTYANECFAKCNGQTKKSDGVCQKCETLCGTPDNPKDTPNPVCGADGITYPTSCFPDNCTNVTHTEGSCG